MTVLENWNARHFDNYAKQHAAGQHDTECEQRERSSLCHCSKRRRVANGFTEPPKDDLYFPPPGCPHCAGELDYDGDLWSCVKCRLSWDRAGDARSARFDDEYGDDFGGERFGRRLLDLVSEGAS